MSMNLLDQGADQRFPVQCDTEFGFDLGNDFRDMKRMLSSLEYVYGHVYVRHTLLSGFLRLSGSRRLELSDRAELS